MKEILVDADVVISFLTDRNQNQQEQAAALSGRYGSRACARAGDRDRRAGETAHPDGWQFFRAAAIDFRRPTEAVLFSREPT
ncbi:MAG TPA: hypothetical protein VKM72_25785 [Thermoanaerobaculia bacterium]|nr:hypothetical protein [Thermoanaerobaculia bacterium]